jgi:hypothetical protein
VRGLPTSLLIALEHSAEEHERSLEGEIRYALKLYARAGWRVHGAALPGPAGGDATPYRPLTIRGVARSVVETLRQYAEWNGCKPREEVVHALAQYVYGTKIEPQRRSLSADELSAHALVDALQERAGR